MSNDEQVNLSNIPADFAAGSQELTEEKRAQIRMTYWVLAGVAVILVVSAAVYIFKPSEASKAFFDFCTNFLPPIVTLVLGAHYVTRSNDSSA